VSFFISPHEQAATRVDRGGERRLTTSQKTKLRDSVLRRDAFATALNAAARRFDTGRVGNAARKHKHNTLAATDGDKGDIGDNAGDGGSSDNSDADSGVLRICDARAAYAFAARRLGCEVDNAQLTAIMRGLSGESCCFF
jgi:hypothetical protein